jgi:hypothetical protein
VDTSDYLKYAAATMRRLTKEPDSDPSLAPRIAAIDAWGRLLASGDQDPETVAAVDELMRQAEEAVPAERDGYEPWETTRLFYQRWRSGPPRVTGAEARRIEEIVRPVFGRPAWHVRLGYGSFITMNFGEPTAENPEHGDWYLWVAMAAWRLESDTEVIVASEYPRRFIRWGIRILEGRCLDGVTVRTPSLETTLRFGDLRLCLFPVYPEEPKGMGDWMLWTPGDLVLTVGEGSRWSYASRTGRE